MSIYVLCPFFFGVVFLFIYGSCLYILVVFVYTHFVPVHGLSFLLLYEAFDEEKLLTLMK